MNGVYSVSESDINYLPPDDCVRLFGYLLHADARRLKLSISRVHFTTRTIPDGGIDASIEGGISQEGDLIIGSESFYQIKAGSEFAPWQRSVMEKELLDGRESKKENLGAEVQRCFQRNGIYILVCMKVQLSTKQKTDAENNLTDILRSCGISEPKVQVWGQDKIIGVVESFPSLVLRLTGRNHPAFQSHDDWSKSREMRRDLILGEKQNKFIEAVRQALLDDSKAIHVNIHGEPGIGKTRLVLEATQIPHLSPLVVYCSSPKELSSSGLLSEIVRDDKLHCILVVDDCDYSERITIWDKLALLGSRVKLVTIFPEYRRADETTQQIPAPNLDDTDIKQIIKKYYDDDILAGRLSRMCDGMPRLAHIIGWDLRQNPNDLLSGSQDAFAFFDRYVHQGEDPKSPHAVQRRRILLTISLFKKFGSNKYFSGEFEAVHKIVAQIDQAITLPIFQEHIQELQRQKILQGNDTFYLSPKALHLWLWMKWWEEYGTLFAFEDLVESLPHKLVEWFIAMLKYVGNSDQAKTVIGRLFEDGGPLSDHKFLKIFLGADLFYVLSNADPATALDYLERTLGTWSDSELGTFSDGRRSIVDGLARIAFEQDLFVRGGTLIRRLAENENQDWANNATGLFAGLFSLAPGDTSLTKAPPAMRAQLLEETLCSENSARRSLGLKACESALESRHFSNLFALPDDELRTDLRGWEPKTYGEWADAYKAVMEIMIVKLQTFPDDDRQKCASIISKYARDLIHAFPFMAEYVIEKLWAIKDFVAKETILEDVIDILAFDKERLDPEIAEKLAKLQTAIVGDDYHSLLKRYVGMDIVVDLAKEDYQSERMEKIRELAGISLDADRLGPELSWLVTGDAKYGYVFGQELAKKDGGFSLMSMLLEEQRQAGEEGSGFFLSGYISLVFEHDKSRWRQIMKEISQDQKLVGFFTEIAWRSGIDDEVGLLTLDLIKSKKINASELGRFVLGGAVKRLSEDVVLKWIECMIDCNDQDAVFGAISLYHSYFIHRAKKTLEPETTLRLLTHDVFMGREPVRMYDTMVDFYWKEIGLRFIGQSPDHSLKLADHVLANMGNTSITSLHSQAMTVLNKISLMNPDQFWSLMTKYIVLPLDRRGYSITSWMRGDLLKPEDSFLDKVDFQKIADWIDHDPHKLAPCMARYSQPILTKDSLPRKLLVRYGSDESVCSSLAANFSTETFSGPASEHFQAKKNRLLAYKDGEDDPNAKKWVDFYIQSLDRDIKRGKLEEERGI